jgi:hypothetical protein
MGKPTSRRARSQMGHPTMSEKAHTVDGREQLGSANRLDEVIVHTRLQAALAFDSGSCKTAQGGVAPNSTRTNRSLPTLATKIRRSATSRNTQSATPQLQRHALGEWGRLDSEAVRRDALAPSLKNGPAGPEAADDKTPLVVCNNRLGPKWSSGGGIAK